MTEELFPGAETPIQELQTPKTFIERHGISPILFAFISLMLIFILYQLIGGIVSMLIFGMKLTVENVFAFRAVTGAGQLLLILIPTLILVRFATLSPKDYLRIRTPDPRTLLLSLVGIFSLQQVLQVYLIVQDKIPIPEPFQSQIQKFKEMIEEAYKQLVSADTIPELLLVLLVIAVIPAIAEEFLFRGLIQRSFEKSLTPMKGAVITGIIFGAYHLNPFALIPLAGLGIYLGFLAFRAESIWVASLAHFFNNALACIATYLHLSDDFVVTGDPQAMSGAGLFGTFLLFSTLFTVSTYYFVKITEKVQDQSVVAPTLT